MLITAFIRFEVARFRMFHSGQQTLTDYTKLVEITTRPHSPHEELELRVEEAQQRSAGRDLGVAVVDHLALVAQVLAVDALGARGQRHHLGLPEIQVCWKGGQRSRRGKAVNSSASASNDTIQFSFACVCFFFLIFSLFWGEATSPGQ